MKENLIKALYAGVMVAIGIIFVMLIKNEEFSLLKIGISALAAFTVDYLFSLIFNKKKR